MATRSFTFTLYTSSHIYFILVWCTLRSYHSHSSIFRIFNRCLSYCSTVSSFPFPIYTILVPCAWNNSSLAPSNIELHQTWWLRLYMYYSFHEKILPTRSLSMRLPGLVSSIFTGCVLICHCNVLDYTVQNRNCNIFVTAYILSLTGTVHYPCARPPCPIYIIS